MDRLFLPPPRYAACYIKESNTMFHQRSSQTERMIDAIALPIVQPLRRQTRIVSLFILFSAFWLSLHLLLRRLTGCRRKAGQLVGCFYCIALGIVSNSAILLSGTLSSSDFLENPFYPPLKGVSSELYIEAYLVAQIAYNFIDIVANPLLEYAVHHTIAMLVPITPIVTDMKVASAIIPHFFLAELGGVPYYVMLVARNTVVEKYVRRCFVYIYGGVRFLGYVPLATFTVVKFFQMGWCSSHRVVCLWCTLGCIGITIIHVRWFMQHLCRKRL